MEWSAPRTGVPGRGRSGATGRQPLVVACLVLFVGFAWAFAAPASGAPAQVGVALFDDDGDTAMFTAADRLAPGRPVQACLRVGAQDARTGDLVTFAATDVSGDLADHIGVTLEAGTGGRFGDCTGFAGSTLWSGTLTALGAASAGQGLATGWQPAVDPVRSFRVTVVVDPALTTQGLSATGDLSWRLFRAAVPPPVDPPTTDEPTTDEPTTAPAPTDPAPTGPPGDPQTDTPTGTAEPTTTPSPTSGSRSPATATPGAGGGQEPPDVTIGGGGLRAMLDVARRATEAAVAVITAPQYPLLAMTVAVLFLAIQDLIDRRDPKLAMASVSRREAELIFPDVLVPGGGRWPI